MATLETLKDQKEQHSYQDPREEWVSTGDTLPSLGLEVLAIADGELTVAHLSDESELGYLWYSWSAAKCLHNVTHWRFHPTLPLEFEIRQREIHAECLTNAGSHCLGDAEHELSKVEAIKESLRQTISKEKHAAVEEHVQAVIPAANQPDTEPNDFGWYDANLVQPYAIHNDICESNPVLGKTAEGRVLLVNFASESWGDGQGTWMYPPRLGLESTSLMDKITYWKPLPDSYLRSKLPWLGTNKNPTDPDAPKIRFWHEQQVIAKAEEEAGETSSEA